MIDMSVPEPTYTTPELVAETMGLPSADDDYGFFQFSDVTSPSANMVKRMIVAAEGEIDRRLNRSWRENQVKDKICTINTYQWDENAWRTAYYLRGGNYINLRRDVRPWDPSKGDKLQIRGRDNNWRDISLREEAEDGSHIVDVPEEHGLRTWASFWIDHEGGRMFLRMSMFQVPYNAVKITYRYGSDEPVPAEISRLCSLMVADRVITMGVFNIKVGGGGDISGVKQDLHRVWSEEIGSIMGAWQRVGQVYSALG